MLVRYPSSRARRSRASGHPEIIVVAVRWYLRFGLSYRDVEELLTERGIDVDHVSVYRWVQLHTALGRRGATVPPRRREPLVCR
jgi:transposase-like protein